MKELLILLLVFTALTFSSGQTYKKMEIFNNYFTLNIKMDPPKYIDSLTNNFRVRIYYGSSGNIQEENLTLPCREIFVALPNNSKPKIKIVEQHSVFFEKTIPQFALVNTRNAITVKSSSRNNDSQPNWMLTKPVIEILGYTRIRNFYCMKIRIHYTRFDPTTIRTEEISEVKLEFELNQSVVPNSELKYQFFSKYDESLSGLIENWEIAPQFEIRDIKQIKLPFDSWIDFNATYLKLGTANDGIYRLYKSDLESNGINTSSIDPKTFKLILRGVQYPIYVKGESKASFSDSDFIEFYGSKNYGANNYRAFNQSNKPYNEYLDRYSDTTIYWLTWGGSKGLRVGEQPFQNYAKSDTLESYTQLDHYESNNFLDNPQDDLVDQQNPDWNKNKTWISGQLNVGIQKSNFSVDNLVQNKIAKAYYKIIGYASDVIQNAHNAGFSINDNSTIYDSSYFNRFDQRLLKGEFSSSILKSGQNSINLTLFPTSATLNVITIDWFDIEYPRYLKLINGSMKFRFTDNLGNPVSFIKINEPSSQQLVIYKIDNQYKRFLNYSKVGDYIFINDSVKTGDVYYAEYETKIQKPVIFYQKKFTDLLSDQNSSEHIIITHPAFKSTAIQYSQFVSATYNLSSKVFDICDIYDQFGYGFFSPEPIREFLRYAYLSWTSQKPSYVFLVGDANYDYYNNDKIKYFVPNYVPSYGYPVSDTWFVVWDSLSIIPQMYVGRLPVASAAEFQHYFDKHRKYVSDDYNFWNKSYLLISGGKSESEQQMVKAVNDSLKNNLILPPNIGGFAGELYATSNPETNFGPFTQSYIDSLISNGGIIISYLGHSGTKIWDNGIEDVSQLRNKYLRNSFITDFGCSTGKFAEPDVISFSEAFTDGLNGDAIGYIGNASLGFTSTSISFPAYFYQEVFKENDWTIGRAHINAKQNYLLNYGTTKVNRIFILCNTLIGDPIGSLKIPPKPNLFIGLQDVHLPKFLDDNLDSIKVSVNFYNLGKVTNEKFKLRVNDLFNGEQIFTRVYDRSLPLNNDSVSINIPCRNLAGKHSISIILDEANQIDEVYENDNLITVEYNISTSAIHSLVTNPINNKQNNPLKFLSPVKYPNNKSFLVEADTSELFATAQKYTVAYDTVVSKVSIPNLVQGKRYWIRTKSEESQQTSNESFSFIYDPKSTSNFYIGDSLSFSTSGLENLSYKNQGLSLSPKLISLIISSAGFEAGGPAKLKLAGTDHAYNPQGCGHHIMVINSKTYEFEDYRWFNYWNDPNNYAALTAYLNSIHDDKIIAVAIGANCGGYGIPTDLIAAYRMFGSTKIDQVRSNTSWIFVGKKNSQPKDVKEFISQTAAVSLDTVFASHYTSGRMTTPVIPFVGEWSTVEIKSNDTASDLKLVPIIQFVKPDTLNPIPIIGNTGDLKSLNQFLNLKIKLQIVVPEKATGFPIELNSLDVSYKQVAELLTNSKLVNLSKDTLTQGEQTNLSFYVYNVGESRADSFKVRVEVVKPDNSREKIFEQIVDSLGADKRKLSNVSFNTATIVGNRNFQITIDSDNKILELYKDNNLYTVPFFVKANDSPASLKLTFDGNDIINGDYVSTIPNIKVELNDLSLIPISDTSHVQLFLNNKRISFVNKDVSYSYSSGNPKFVVNYKPSLGDGTYTLKVLGTNATGQLIDSAGVVRKFIVSNNAQLLYVYNYPNPFSNETFFTFKLTQIPDELKIKIFTVSGRLIKELIVPPSNLSYDFNRIEWDGRDEDGDLVANGVYLYKVIMKKGTETIQATQKLAIVR